MLSVKPYSYDIDVPISGYRFVTFIFSMDDNTPIDLTPATVKTEAWNVDRTIKFFDIPTYKTGTNTIKIEIKPPTSNYPPPETAHYDILAVWPDNTKDWLVRGTISFHMTYTRQA